MGFDVGGIGSEWRWLWYGSKGERYALRMSRGGGAGCEEGT